MNATASAVAGGLARRSLLRAAMGSAALGAASLVAAQPARRRFRFGLGDRIGGLSAGFFLAQARGHYERAGLEVEIVADGDSYSALQRLGVADDCDAACVELPCLVEFRVQNPGARPQAIAVLQDLTPHSAIVLADGPIRAPSDFVGKSLCALPLDNSRRLFPGYMATSRIKAAQVDWVAAEPALAHAGLLKGQYQAVARPFYDGLMELRALGIDAQRLRVFRYADSLRTYGQAIVAGAHGLQREPEALRAFVEASTRGWMECMADPESGIAALPGLRPALDKGVELARLRMMIDATMRTPDTLANGWGGATTRRLMYSIMEPLMSYGWRGAILQTGDLWTDRFLPPPQARRLQG